MGAWKITGPDGRIWDVSSENPLITREHAAFYLRNKYYLDESTPGESDVSEPEEDDSFLSETKTFLEQRLLDPLIRGKNNLEIAGAVLGKEVGLLSPEVAAESISEDVADISKVPMPEDVQEGLKEIRESGGFSEGWSGVVDSLQAVATNPSAVVDVALSSLVTSLPALAGFIAGAKVGTAIAPVAGTIAGAATGTAIGSFAVEYGNSLIDAMNDGGVDTSNAEEVLGFFNDPEKMSEAREFAVKRGVPIALFDALSAGVAGRLFSPVAKALSNAERVAVASEAGLNAARIAKEGLEGVGAMTARDQLKVGRAAAKATTRGLGLAPRAGAASAELLTQMASGASGEAAAQLVSEGEVSSFGEVILEAAAEGPIGGIESILGARGPRVSPVIPEPGFPGPEKSLTDEDLSSFVDEDPIGFLEARMSGAPEDLPLSFDNTGSVLSDEGDYNVEAVSGTTESGEAISGFQVKTSDGRPITPVIETEEQAEEAKEFYVNSIDRIIENQEGRESKKRALAAMGEVDPYERSDLLNLAETADQDTVIPIENLNEKEKTRLTNWRKDEGLGMSPVNHREFASVEELVTAKVAWARTQKRIDELIGAREDLGAPEKNIVEEIENTAREKGIVSTDEAFDKFARRISGATKGKNSWTKMRENQLIRLRDAVNNLGSVDVAFKGPEPTQSLIVPERVSFSAPQYDAVIASARNKAIFGGTSTWDVTGSPGDERVSFNSEEEATSYVNSQPVPGDFKIKQRNVLPTKQGEIKKSDVSKILGRNARKTDAILNEGVRRGDLVKTSRDRWRYSDYHIIEKQPHLPALKNRLAARLRSVGKNPDRIAIELLEGLEENVEGDYSERVIRIALNQIPEGATDQEAQDILGEILDHETIHALFELGVFDRDEINTLFRYVSKQKIPDRKVTYAEVAYDTYSGLDEYRMTGENGDVIPDDNKILEEAVAEAFRDFAAGRLKPVGRPRNLLKRIIDFFRGIASVDPADANYFMARFTPIRRGIVGTTVSARQMESDTAGLDVNTSRRLSRKEVDKLQDDELLAQGQVIEFVDEGRRERTRQPIQYVEMTPALMQHKKNLESSMRGKGSRDVKDHLNPDELIALSKAGAASLVEQYRNLPPWQQMADVALSGRAKRGWYKQSQEALEIVFGGGQPGDLQRFVALLAALSPQTSVESNLENSLRVWAGWVNAGRPTGRAEIERIMGENVQGEKADDSVLNAWKSNSFRALSSEDPESLIISGPKVNSFMLNLLGFSDEVTADTWMANFGGVGQKTLAGSDTTLLPGKTPGYLAMTILVRKTAAELSKRTGETWTPAEVQETVWSWVKALYEKMDSKGETRNARAILKEGGLTHEEVGEVPDYKDLLVEGRYREMLAGVEGYEERLNNLASLADREVEETGTVYGEGKINLDRVANRLTALRNKKRADAVRREIILNLSSYTPTIPGLNKLYEAIVGARSEIEKRRAASVLQNVASDSMEYLLSGLDDARTTMENASGVFDGYAEPSLKVGVSYKAKDSEKILAIAARFAENFNQEQIIVRGGRTNSNKNHIYPDGSYNSVVHRFYLTRNLPHDRVQAVAKQVGLEGLTIVEEYAADEAGNLKFSGYLETFYVGDPNNEEDKNSFNESASRLPEKLGGDYDAQRGYQTGVERIQTYGNSPGDTPYSRIQNQLRPKTKDIASATAQRIASMLAGYEVSPGVTPTQRTKEERDSQAALQREIAEAYDSLKLNNLGNPAVMRAYRELAEEVTEQYESLPIKVEVWKGEGEPYAGKNMSQRMRQDVLLNNHLYIYKTEAETFGPEGVDYVGEHPLLEQSGKTDINGEPLLVNDLLRAVHDYYAHSMSTAGFGPVGEEVAWKNHMVMTRSPWARWALTTETRGQNSWVNFRPEVKGKSLRERGFAEQKVDLLPIAYAMVEEPSIDESLAEIRDSDVLVLGEREPSRRQSRRRRDRDDNRILSSTERSAKRAREATRDALSAYARFKSESPNANYPVADYNGGVTPALFKIGMNEDGTPKYKAFRVFMMLGHNEWSESEGKNIGWGQRHTEQHLEDIKKNTNYSTVDSFISGMLNMYHANRLRGTLEEAGFEVFETDAGNTFDGLRGRKLVIRWNYDKWAQPGTLVLQLRDFDGIEYRGDNDLSHASVVTAYALPAVGKSVGPRITGRISTNVSRTAQRAAGKASPHAQISIKKKRRYSINSPDNLSRDYANLGKKLFGKAPPKTSLGAAILNAFSRKRDKTRPSDLRRRFIDQWESVAKQEIAKGGEIWADSSASAMLATLERAPALLKAYMTTGGIIYSGGMFSAINEEIVENSNPAIRERKRADLERMRRRAGYGRRDRVKGLIEILEPLNTPDMRDRSALHAWQIYAAARRAQRLINEGRENLMSEEDIAKGLSIASDLSFMVDGQSIIESVYEDYQRLNKTLIGMMEDANLISAEAAQLWIDNSDYLPFYRELYVFDSRDKDSSGSVINKPKNIEDQDEIVSIEDSPNNQIFNNLYNMPAPRELRGGRESFFVMVGDVRDTSVYSNINDATARRDELRGENADNPVVSQKDIRVSTSTQRIQDPLENILRNANAAITASMRNVGVLRALRNQVQLGMAERLPEGSWDGTFDLSKVGVKIRGETVWFHTNDRMLLNSLQATGYDFINSPMMKLLTIPANVLRELVTKTPDFMAANMFRDTLSAWVTSGVSFVPVLGTIMGYINAIGGDPSATALRAAGVVGGYDFKNDPKDAMKSMEKMMRQGFAGKGDIADYWTRGWMPSINTPFAPATKMWQMLDDATGASDMATRIAVYNSVLDETGNEAQATYEALEVLNFSRRGAAPGIKILTAIIPFLNARIQGLDLLYRAGTSPRGVTGFRAAQRKQRFIWRMLTLTALGSLYALSHSDDPDEDPYYANATKEKRDQYFIVSPQWFGIDPATWSGSVPKFPIPFEVGLLTKVIPERIIRLMSGSDRWADFSESLLRNIQTTLEVQIPQAVLPLVEAMSNHDFYRGAPIVSFYSQKDAPEDASGIGESSRELARLTGIDAEIIEHILLGYTGTMGTYALQGIDSIAREFKGRPDAPAFNIHEYPVLRRFSQGEFGGGDKQQFYALKEELDALVASLRVKRGSGRSEELVEMLQDPKNKRLLFHKKIINDMDRRLANLRAMKQRIRDSERLSSSEKRDAINKIKRGESLVIRRIWKISRAVNA